MNASRRAAALRALASGVRYAAEDLAGLAAMAEERAAAEPPGDPVLIAGWGALVHGFYNELEKTMLSVARDLDGFEPKGEDWHAALAAQIARDLPGLRPAVVPASLAAPLRELRAFRHLFRHLYVLDLDAHRVQELLGLLAATWRQLEPSLSTFAAALETMAVALEPPG